MSTWDRIKHHLSQTVSAESFQNWFASTEQREEFAGTLVVRVPTEAAKIWLEQEYGEQVSTSIAALHLEVRSVVYETAPSPSAMSVIANGDKSGPPSEITFASPTTQLNPRYTFNSFVVGSCNQFAHAAARAVADHPANRYNPLFIYGGVGMGKTHLMHAIGRALMEHRAGMRIVYTSSERFMNEMIASIRTDKMSQFHQHYRNADALLVDDVQILANRERTQEEFFHTFNELYEHGKQIVISSDRPPKEVSGLMDRLRSRFEWGLMVDVQPPDLETKMAILDKKSEAEGVELPEDVRIHIATKTKSNVRELEGALVKLIAYSSVTDTPISLAMAQQVLRNLSAGAEKRITVESIIKAVAEKFSLQPAQLKQKTNVQQIAYPRQIAMYLCKELTPASLPEIGRHFNGKHHTTVLHSVQKIDKLRQRDADLNRIIHSITDSF
ncbi:MAG TPA: chromosomal replication initiator protein DnaA [Bryobacteraceae bacterium]|nr:chromosomal replication initiator protein DnaA [Bryobacteraceae bacterium]